MALLTFALALGPGDRHAGAGQAPAAPSRIVSIVPAATEMLFAIGAGPLVVGVSSFDRYPPEVATRTRVGALVDPDLERILQLRADLVVLYASQDDLRQQLRRAAISTFGYRHGGVADIAGTMRALGTRVGRAAEAERAAADLETRLAGVGAQVAGRTRPRTLLVFGRQPGTLRSIYASGGTGFLHDMLVTAGGANVFADIPREGVQVTSELVLARRPDAIVELQATGLGGESVSGEDRAWQTLGAVPAVRSGRIIVLRGDEFVVPGPRVADATERLARALHPDAFSSVR